MSLQERDEVRKLARGCKGMTYAECELFLVEEAVRKIQRKTNRKIIRFSRIHNIISIAETFIRNKKLIMYGGTSLNNILPAEDQFYNQDENIPDLDVFSSNALDHVKEIADIYVHKHGFQEVEAKAGMHHGTFKLYVHFIPVLDITNVSPNLFKALQRDAIERNGLLYAPPNFLRMSMYLELSRPAGDVSRWRKVLQRLMLLNKRYPLMTSEREIAACRPLKHQQNNDDTKKEKGEKEKEKEEKATIRDAHFSALLSVLIQHRCVFIGGYALNMYAHTVASEHENTVASAISTPFDPTLDVLVENPTKLISDIKSKFVRLFSSTVHNMSVDVGNKNDNNDDDNTSNNKDQMLTIVTHPPFDELLAEYYEIRVNRETLLFVYKPNACHSYNIVPVVTPMTSLDQVGKSVVTSIRTKKHDIRIASIDTLLSFYLTFWYRDVALNADSVIKNKTKLTRILCMCQFLLDVQTKNKLSQKGILRRFSIRCIGHQPTKEEIRANKDKILTNMLATKHHKPAAAATAASQPKVAKQPEAKKEAIMNDIGDNKQKTREYEMWFLRYRPTTITVKNNKLKKHKQLMNAQTNKTKRHLKKKETRKIH